MDGERERPAAFGKRMVLTGATGLIGRRIAEILLEGGAEVVALTRDPERARRTLGEGVTPVFWDFDHPEQGNWRQAMEGAHGVIHLAGTPLFERRWDPAFKRRMRESRVQGTRQLADAVRLISLPSVLKSFSLPTPAAPSAQSTVFLTASLPAR